MASKSTASRSAATGTSSVCRSLFHHTLSRRPTSASTSTSATTLQEGSQDESSDIVVKDRNGNYQVQVPLLPPLDEDQAQEEDSGNEKESTVGPLWYQEAMANARTELDARLLEMYRDRSLQPHDPAGQSPIISLHLKQDLSERVTELLNAVHASLRRKVASLDEDNWIFEAEQESTGG